MKHIAAFALLAAASASASAQSSVTLFGVVDANARWVKNGDAGSIKSLSTSGNETSRLGFRGVEDLGGGLKASFHIEGELVNDTGNPAGQNWQRRSTVSLLGGFGEVRLGRDYTPTFWSHYFFDPFGTVGVGSQLNMMTQQGQTTLLGSGATTLVRASNSVGFLLPNMGGVFGQAMVAAGEGAVGNKYWGGRVGYRAGPIHAAVAYGRTDLGASDLKGFNAGASYDFGFMNLMAQYNRYEAGASEQKNFLIGATAPVGPGTLLASYNKASGSGAGAGDATMLALGYVYDLSKRTAVYTTFARIDNDAGSRFVASGSGPVNPITGQKSTGYEMGLRHRF